MARHINPNMKTNKTIDAIDRKRERERYFLLTKARDHAAELATSLVQSSSTVTSVVVGDVSLGASVVDSSIGSLVGLDVHAPSTIASERTVTVTRRMMIGTVPVTFSCARFSASTTEIDRTPTTYPLDIEREESSCRSLQPRS